MRERRRQVEKDLPSSSYERASFVRHRSALHADSVSEEKMNILAKAILRRIFDRIETAGDQARLPAVYRNAGGGLMSHIAAARSAGSDR